MPRRVLPWTPGAGTTTGTTNTTTKPAYTTSARARIRAVKPSSSSLSSSSPSPSPSSFTSASNRPILGESTGNSAGRYHPPPPLPSSSSSSFTPYSSTKTPAPPSTMNPYLSAKRRIDIDLSTNENSPNENRKRSIEVVDLTADDNDTFPSSAPQPPALPRKIPRFEAGQTWHKSGPNQTWQKYEPSRTWRRNPNLNPAALFSQAPPPPSTAPPSTTQRDDRDEWDEDRNEILIPSQDSRGNEALESFHLYGILHTKIVGVQYYHGCANRGEYVLVQREPTNQYDAKAIQVTNVQRQKIGHLSRGTAAMLAPYLDSGRLVVSGVLAGDEQAYGCPIAISLFGTSDPIAQEELKRDMKSDNLPLDDIAQREKDAKTCKADELRRMMAARRVLGNAQDRQQNRLGFTGSSTQGIGELMMPTMEDITAESEWVNTREMGQVVEKFGMDEDTLSHMPMAEPVDRLRTSLLPYQRQALAWLLEKENPQLPPPGSKEAVQLWKRQDGSDNVYTNVATKFSVKAADPKLACGGILADDMGLGKTLEIIALIVADQSIQRQKKVSEKEPKTTLIVAPLSVMSNWSGQIVQHVDPDHPLRVLTYHGPNRNTVTPKDLAQFDVVITTYATLSREYDARLQPGLFAAKWRRIVLDEGHIIRNPGTKFATAATNLTAEKRWILTGTPIINTLKDLYSLVKFIGLTGGLEKAEIFTTVLTRPLKVGDEGATLLLQALMGTICLRRRKDMKFVDLKVPPLTEYIHRVKFLSHEKEKYEALKSEAQGLVRRAQNEDGIAAQQAYRHLLEILLRLRQVCNHWKLCSERVTSLMQMLESQNVVDLTPENRKALQDVLQLSIESHEDCPVCLESLHNHDPVITHCAHIFGSDCITRVIETQHKCPMCRAELPDDRCLVQPAAGLGEAEERDIDIDTSSSKIEALLDILHATRTNKPGTKTILFSQWTSFLNIVQKQLVDRDYGFCRIDGTMDARARDQALHVLAHDPGCTIMLASLSVCAVGLNLVAANQVILMDSWWAPAIEDQAIDRVHRLGQTKETTVFRLVMEDSVEEWTLEIQQEKRKLMMAAFQEKTSKRMEGKTARMADIQKLLK